MNARKPSRIVVVGFSVLALLLSACRDDDSNDSVRPTPTTEVGGDEPPADPVKPVFAYYGGGYVSVRNGAAEVARVETDMCCSNAPAMAWSGDQRYVAVVDSAALHVVDVDTGKVSRRECECATTVAIWGGRVVSAGESYTPDSRLMSYALPDLSDPKPLDGDLPSSPHWQALETVGEDLMVVGTTDSGGARDQLATFLVHPNGTITPIGEARPGRQVTAEYAADTAYGGPRVAYVWSASSGACSAVDSVSLIDPKRTDRQVDTDSAAVFPGNDPDANNLFHDVWFGSDGYLYASAYSLSYCSGAAKMLAPVSVWRLNGNRWVKAEDRALLTVRDFGSSGRVELLTEPAAPAATEARMTGGVLTWVAGGRRQQLAPSAITVSAPPARGSDPAIALMAKQFAPMVYLAEGEENRPANASTFVQRSKLMWDRGLRCAHNDVVAASVTEAGLAAGEYKYRAKRGCRDKSTSGPEFATNQDTAPKRSELVPGLQGFYLDLDDGYRGGEAGQAPVYWEYVPGEAGSGKAAFIYWLFYAYNKYHNLHEGDWERVAVQLKDDQPTGVTFWKHNEPPCSMPWNRLDNWEGHPITYAAKGSHGSYHSAGDFKHPGGTDHTNQGYEWRTWEAVTEVSDQAWWGYAGAWGEQVFANNVPGLKEFSGPDGPNPVYDKGAARGNALTDRSCGIVGKVFQGQWKTDQPVELPNSMRSTIELRIGDGALGEDVGTVQYDSLGCRGQLALVAEKEVDMEVSVTMHDLDPSVPCGLPGGTILLTARGGGLRFHHTGAPDNPDWALSTDLVRR